MCIMGRTECHVRPHPEVITAKPSTQRLRLTDSSNLASAGHRHDPTEEPEASTHDHHVERLPFRHN